ncbi:endonuclease VIII Nei2 [soil metagenome]
MPEGDTVWRTAYRLHEALAREVLTSTDFRVPAFATADLSGPTVDEVVSRGKHLLIRTPDFSIHSHLKMEGAWHVYDIGSRWRRPAFEARVVLETATRQAVGFALGVTEIVARDKEDTVVGHLGPDPLGPDWDLDEATRRVQAQPEQPIYIALMDQRNVAGFGNVYVNELCFLTGVLPTRPVADVRDVRRMIQRGQQMLRANRDRVERTMTGDTRRGHDSWVFSRERRPCRRCGERILHAQLGPDPLRLRNTFWCPRCQV